MSYFEGYTDNGMLQLSPEITFASCIIAQNFSTGSSISFSAQSSFYIDLPNNVIPLIATRSAAGVAFYYSNDIGNNTNRYWFNSNGPQGTSVIVYVFNTNSNPQTNPNGGFELYNPNGSIAFSSTTTAAKIIGTTQSSLQLIPGRKYAACIPAFAGYRHQTTDTTGGTIVQKGIQYGCQIIQGSNNSSTANVVEVDFLSSTQVTAAPDIDIPLDQMYVFDVTSLGVVPGENPSSSSISPSQQSSSETNSSGHLFQNETVTFYGTGSPSYNWGVLSSSNGRWYVNSGQSTSQARYGVDGVQSGDSSSASCYCDVSANGSTNRLTFTLAHRNIQSTNQQ